MFLCLVLNQDYKPLPTHAEQQIQLCLSSCTTKACNISKREQHNPSATSAANVKQSVNSEAETWVLKYRPDPSALC